MSCACRAWPSCRWRSRALRCRPGGCQRGCRVAAGTGCPPPSGRSQLRRRHRRVRRHGKTDTETPGEGGDAPIWSSSRFRLLRLRAHDLILRPHEHCLSIATVGILLDFTDPDRRGHRGRTRVRPDRRHVRGRHPSTLVVAPSCNGHPPQRPAGGGVRFSSRRLCSGLQGWPSTSTTSSNRELTAFISHPDGLGAVVALLAGIVGCCR